ncbi:MAG: hypothetical protein IJI46_00475 [Erysipelotrichaceae bacterium]|nr:hypothetical protein [Erysipelotrichaceae bacterium]
MKVLINDSVSVEFPDEYAILSKEELKRLYLDDNPDRWAIRNEDDHVTIAIFYHRFNALLGAFAGNKEICQANEKKLAKGLKDHDYVFKGFFEKMICEHQAYGFDYEYQVNSISQIAKTIVMKHGNICYTLYYYVRPGYEEKGQKVFEDFLNSVSFN